MSTRTTIVHKEYGADVRFEMGKDTNWENQNAMIDKYYYEKIRAENGQSFIEWVDDDDTVFEINIDGWKELYKDKVIDKNDYQEGLEHMKKYNKDYIIFELI